MRLPVRQTDQILSKLAMVDQYYQFVSRAVDWIDRNLENFDPLKNPDKLDEQRQQAMGELALLSMYLLRSSAFEHDPRPLRFLKFIARVSCAGTFRDRLLREEEDFLPQVLFLATLRRTGVSNGDYYFQIAQQLIDTGNFYIGGVPVHRMLELRYALDLGGFNHRLPSYRNLIRSSCLGKRINLIRFTDINAYYFTHAIFHASDFGFVPIRGLANSALSRVRRDLELLIVSYCNAGHLDLLGELLLSSHCLQSKDTEICQVGWSRLLQSQALDGSLPGPYFRLAEMEAVKGEERRQYLFEKRYHTTLVGALAAALSHDVCNKHAQ